MGRPPSKYTKFRKIPTEFVDAHRTEIINACDKETESWCYCGRLSKGLHTSLCREYRRHFRMKMEELYNANTDRT